MSQPASSRRRPPADASPAPVTTTTTSLPPLDADADPNLPAHFYSQYASSPPRSPRRRPPPPPTSRRPDVVLHDVATAQSHDSRPHPTHHTLSQDAHSFHNLQDLHAAARHSPPSLKPLLPIPSALGPGPRSPRPTAPSPLSTSQQYDTRTSSNIGAPFDDTPPRSAPHNRLAARTTFYSDSSNPSSPEQEIESPRFPNVSNDNRSFSEPLTSKKSTAAPGPSNLAMKGPVVAAPTGSTKPKPLPRNSSLDTAISAMAAHEPSGNSPSSSSSQAPDIAHLITTAGSPEAVIKYLLKEKQSQSQQNSQLWRLVDKQRAMILGLNNDLEAALKDKERYRKKLKELVNNSSLLRAAAGRPAAGGTRESRPAPRVDVNRHHGMNPDSPVLESDSQKDSPVDLTMAPYPITPPADRPQQVIATGVADVLDPSRSMPKPQEHALNNYDHEAEDRAEEHARKQRGEEQLREIPFSVSLPPSRTFASEPPKVPPPQLPPGSESPPRKAEAAAKPTATPRKGPPAPLQLPKGRRSSPLPVGEVSDSESDYDGILGVEQAGSAERGRSRTRGDGGDLIANHLGNQSTLESQRSSPVVAVDEPSSVEATVKGNGPEAATASLAAVLNGDRHVLVPPMMSPGLPLSPRPTKTPGQSPPLSPRTKMPLSPRPPRQPIPLPPNTPLAASSSASSVGHARPIVPSIRTVDLDEPSPRDEESSPTENNQVFKGLAADEYPDLLLPPNALPSIDVKVASSRMKPSRASLLSLSQLEEDPVFTLAVISRADRGELWRVEKDTTSLSKLDQRMKQCQLFTAKTPERSLFSGHSPAKLDARRQVLETYMDELLNTQLDEATALELCRYLSTNTLPPNADEIGAVAKLTPDHSAHHIGPDGRAVRTGYLTKKGKNFGGWKVRFFVVNGPNLKYYETPGGPHLGTIKLQGAQIGKQSHSSDNQSPAPSSTGEEFDNQYRHAFLILEPKRKDSSSHVKHVLCAEDDKERDDWVDALLQWIDFRETDDTDGRPPKSDASERQHQELTGAAKMRKSQQARAISHAASDSGSLIGVRYDSTNAGDAPQHGNIGRPKPAPVLSEQPSMQSFGADAPPTISTPKLISAPKDLQLISDVSTWGNKLGPPQPSVEDKKQRKRSFFGFGPKTRSSSDGQDSLFGSDSGTMPHGLAFHGGQVFGSSLAEAVQYHPPKDVDLPLPSVIYRCIQYLEARNGLNEEGIFRLSGSNTVIKQLRERFNNESDINLITDETYYDIHAVASLLKLYLRELPSSILTRDLNVDFFNTTEMSNRDEKIAMMAHLIQRLPEANLTLLKYLISFLIRIINNCDVNKMNARNIGIVFSPTLNIPAPVFATFLHNFEGIFGIDPEEYELPTAAGPIKRSYTEGSSRSDGPSRQEVAPRPSTSSGSASSPHRPARVEAVRGPSRSTPTPPLAQSRASARQSPTPSTASGRPAYEPSHLVQQNTGVVANVAPLRPGYEPNRGLEQAGVATGPRPTPAYERAAYQLPNGPGSSMSLTSGERGNKRRESSIYFFVTWPPSYPTWDGPRYHSVLRLCTGFGFRERKEMLFMRTNWEATLNFFWV
ncbi:RhoGAP domain-containing protein [Cordyceps militaris CM01]|uniref:RhoGAP domain-containing protein n=1 Tax=Cordyceps militaris (strain CM01) TaxID=983644 RepID=G3JJ59_CORMM|nr:RhoGAP domain-containing protein [Cordyceps militaris CM01]EGX92001.1 RhoGAP domain-containing protein [Cordyceps militaris CM01]